MSTYLIIVIVFVVGGIIYQMGKSNNDFSQAPEGGCLGFLSLLSLCYVLFPFLLILGIIVFLVKSCS